MDQMTAACGKADQLLSLLCQPAILQEPIPIPDHVSFWGIDSGMTHSVSGADYGSVRVGAFMGYRIIAELTGFPISPQSENQQIRINDAKWNGYLANIPPSVYEHYYAASLPAKMKGSTFIGRYQGNTDRVTKVDPELVYRIAAPTAHAIYEHFRVRTFAELLRRSRDQRALEQLGELMYQSHSSYSACGLGSEGTDRLVELARELGLSNGVYGAKITGGGSGGTVAVIGRADAYNSVEMIAKKYAEETGHPAHIFAGSSLGADEFGCLVLRNG